MEYCDIAVERLGGRLERHGARDRNADIHVCNNEFLLLAAHIFFRAMEILVTVMQLVVQILGALDVQALFKPVSVSLMMYRASNPHPSSWRS